MDREHCCLLVVEDETSVRESLSGFLEDHGFFVEQR